MKNVNSYLEMKQKHQKDFNDISKKYMFFAFNNKQFNEGMEKLGLSTNQTDEIISVGAGGYILKSHKDDLGNLSRIQFAELQEAIANDKTGTGFIYEMFLYELRNHEYQVTEDEYDTLDAIGLTWNDIHANPSLKNGLEKASRRILAN